MRSAAGQRMVQRQLYRLTIETGQRKRLVQLKGLKNIYTRYMYQQKYHFHYAKL